MMIQLSNSIKKNNINIDDYTKDILKIIYKFTYEEQTHIKKELNIKSKQDIEIELKLKNFSKDTDCCVCLEEQKCIPFNWCNHYLCVNCIIKCSDKCPYCRYS